MAIHIMIAEQLWYNDLIQGRKRPDGHIYHDCGAIMIYIINTNILRNYEFFYKILIKWVVKTPIHAVKALKSVRCRAGCSSISYKHKKPQAWDIFPQFPQPWQIIGAHHLSQAFGPVRQP